jgi:hypothetical protein
MNADQPGKAPVVQPAGDKRDVVSSGSSVAPADQPGVLERPLVFISHKDSDRELAEQVRDWMRGRAGGRLDFFLSYEGYGDVRTTGRTLTDVTRSRAADASVMVVLCTSSDQDWIYVMLELGVALDPENPKTTVVALDCGYELPPLKEAIYAKVYDVDSQVYGDVSDDGVFPYFR